METVNITSARADLYKVIDSVIFGPPKRINTKNGNAILVSEQDWRNLQETLRIMSNPKLAAELKERMKTPLSECVDEGDIDWNNI